MTHIDQDDGITYLDGHEQWHVTGYVTVRVSVDFRTTYEPSDFEFDNEIKEAVDDVISTDYEIEDYDGLDFEPERIEEDW